MEKLRYKIEEDRLEPKEIVEIVDGYKDNVVPEVRLKTEYSKGNNPTILERVLPQGSPQNKLPVPYGRRIVNLVTSYMYLPGLVTYGSKTNQAYFDKLKQIFDYNKEDLETYKIGWQTTVQGVGYEIFYVEGIGPELTAIDHKIGYRGTMPRFVKVPVEETIPIYNFDIIPELQAFIRFYTEGEDDNDIEHIHVYYSDVVEEYVRDNTQKGRQGLSLVGEQPHGFDRPPLVVYENNEDMIGDFAAVVPLINAYDVLMSDSMNEFDRFAQAYLVAKGFTITEEEAEKMKYSRAFSLLNPEDSLEFLTKPIEVDFIKHQAEELRAEIHRGSGIPNLDDYKWGSNASGETLDKWIYLMELFTGIKEAYFKEGLRKRIEMITTYMGLTDDPADIDVVMNRNDPDKSMLLADLMEKYTGHVSDQTLLENFADFVDDVEEELARLKEEQQEKAEVDLDRFEARTKAGGLNKEEDEEEKDEEEEE